MKTWNKTITLLRNDKQQIVANGYPYLRIDGILGSTVECLYVQVLLNPLEEELYLPSFPVEFCNCQRVFDGIVVGQETEEFPRFKVFIYNKSKRIWILSGGVISGKPDGLIRNKTRASIDRPGLKNPVDHVILSSGNEIGAIFQEVPVKFFKRNVSLVHQVESSRFDGNFIHPSGIIYLTWRKQDKCQNRAAQVHQSMHLYRSLAMMELSPRTQIQTELDSAAVKRINYLFETNPQLFILVKRDDFFNQSHCKVLIDVPIRGLRRG